MRASSAGWFGLAGIALAGAAAAEEVGVGPAGMAGVYRTIGLAVAAAVTMVGCVLAAAYAVARIGSAVMGASAEKPELLTRSLLFVALAEGLAVLGFAVAALILQKM